MALTPVILIVIVVLYLLSCLKVLNEHERGILLRLGRLVPRPVGPGLVLVLQPLDRMFRVKAAELAGGSTIVLMDGLT